MGTRVRIAAALALSVSLTGLAFIKGHEGVQHHAYPDPVRGWAVPTICAGHTLRVRRGDRATPAQCAALLAEDAEAAAAPLRRCVTAPLNQNEADALVDFSLNVGGRAACASTLVRKLNLGDRQGAADEFRRWHYAGGKDCRVRGNRCRGLLARREAERSLFLEDPS